MGFRNLSYAFLISLATLAVPEGIENSSAEGLEEKVPDNSVVKMDGSGKNSSESRRGQNNINVYYDAVLNEIDSMRKEYRKDYSVSDNSEKQEILEESRKFLLDKTVNSIIPAWHGTEYNYYGSAAKPGEGGIACGHFVSAVVKHAGFDVDRYSLGRQPSEYIVKSLTNDIDRYSNYSIEEFVESMSNKENGLYILGLDNHTGIVVKESSDFDFCHSAYYDPYGVTCESLESSSAVKWSNYRVVGKLFGDEMMENWIEGNHIDHLKYNE